MGSLNGVFLGTLNHVSTVSGQEPPGTALKSHKPLRKATNTTFFGDFRGGFPVVPGPISPPDTGVVRRHWRRRSFGVISGQEPPGTALKSHKPLRKAQIRLFWRFRGSSRWFLARYHPRYRGGAGALAALAFGVISGQEASGTALQSHKPLCKAQIRPFLAISGRFPVVPGPISPLAYTYIRITYQPKLHEALAAVYISL